MAFLKVEDLAARATELRGHSKGTVTFFQQALDTLKYSHMVLHG